MRRLLLVANPSASGFTGALHRDVVTILSETFDVTKVWPDRPAEARAVAADAAADGFEIVAAMGGDGVVHHVANGLVHSASALAIIPTGTTNVLARIYGIPQKPRKAAEMLRKGVAGPVSVAHVATESESAARSEYALFSLGVGFDADVVASADSRPHSKLWFGSLHYARSTLGQAFGAYRGRPANLRVECFGDRVDAVAVFVQVHDLYTYFGAIPISLSTTPAGELTAIAVEKVSTPVIATVAARLAARRDMAQTGGVHSWHDFAKLVIQAEPAAPFQADGEMLGTTDGLEVTPEPGALLVVHPAE
jgi:diacylglycerol kinase family enzyme